MVAAEQHEGYNPVPAVGADSLPVAHDAFLPVGNFLYSSLPEDTWGVALFAVVNDLPDIMSGEAAMSQVVRFAFAMFVLFVNILMQISILNWVGVYVVGTSVRMMQEHYIEYHAQSFDADGAFNEGKWEHNLHLRQELCDAALSQFAFLFFICFLWAARILVEIRASIQLLTRIQAIRILPPGAPNAHMVLETERTGEQTYDIVALSKGARAALYVLVLIPKVLIALFLLYIGVKWLASTASFKDLILNALGLEFVLSIDELFFFSFFPEQESDTVKAAHWATPKPDRTPEESQWDTIVLYSRSAFYIFTSIGFVYVYLIHYQAVLPKYQWDINHCHKYQAKYLSPLCLAGDGSCFPFGR